MKILSLLLALFIFLSSCSSQPLIRYQESHRAYLLKVKAKKETSSPEDYKSFILNQIQAKEMELANLQEIQEGAQLRHSESEGQQTQQIGDINHFKKNTAMVELHQIKTRMNFIEKEIFFLKSQLSSLK